jgi:hypothetical protein
MTASSVNATGILEIATCAALIDANTAAVSRLPNSRVPSLSGADSHAIVPSENDALTR